MLTSLAFKMAIMGLLGLLMEACHAEVGPKQTHKQTTTSIWPGVMVHTGRAIIADVNLNQFVLQNTPTFFDNDTLLAPNIHGEMVLHTIVDMTWELDIPGTANKINITGTANKVIDYINTNYPNYIWSDIDELNITSLEMAIAIPGPYPNCDIFSLAPYPMATAAQKSLKELGNHYFNLGNGPGTCAQAECKEDLQGRHAAIWWCNDVSEPQGGFSHSCLMCLHNS